MSLIAHTKMSMMSLDSMGPLCICSPWLTTMPLSVTFVRESGLVALLLLQSNSMWFQGVRVYNAVRRSKILWLGLETECTQEHSRKRTVEKAKISKTVSRGILLLARPSILSLKTATS